MYLNIMLHITNGQKDMQNKFQLGQMYLKVSPHNSFCSYRTINNFLRILKRLISFC